MTHQNSAPADSHFLHDTTADRPPHLHAQRDTRSSPGERAGETMGGGNCTDRICIEHLSEDNPPEITSAGGTSRSLLRHQPAAPTQNSGSLDSQDMTQETLETYLFSNERSLYWLGPSDLSSFWSAPKDPPVTKASLSELDLERISSDARLRHDVNFDREVSFKPNLQGDAGKKKLALAEEYWVALRIEFTLYLVRRRVMFSHGLEGLGSTDSPWLLGPSVAAKVPLRLPRMFGVIKEILKTLVPQADWSTVDARLDVELLIQELENGVCDLVALSKWLGDLLQGSCSPMRDTTVRSAVSMIQRGVKQDNAWRMVLGLRDFFGILETMKLDVANHQIRTLRLLMVEDFVSFQQKTFLSRIPNEPSLRNARRWFRAFDRTNDKIDKPRRPPQLNTFLMAVLHLIISNDKDLPSTFEYDFDRLSALQVHFQSYLMVAGCCQIFAKTLQLLGQGKAPSPELYHSLVNCIRALAPCLGSTSNDDREQRIQDVALEIVREAYSVCNIQSLPDSTLVKGIEGWVRIWWHSKSIAYENLEKTYRKELWDLLMENVDTVMKMTPLQMLDWLNPPPSKREPKTEGISMSSMARRLAHIAILHWRIWAPILYQQPWDSHMDPLIVDPNSVERQVDLTSPSVVQSPENGPRKSLQWSSEEDRGDEV